MRFTTTVHSGCSMPTDAIGVGDGLAHHVEVIVQETDMVLKMSWSIAAYAGNATMSCRQSMRQDGMQSTEPKKEFVDWRVPTIATRMRRIGEMIHVPFVARVRRWCSTY